MMNFSEEIENCLKDVRNTNNKEQNFQGRLYAHFLKFEEEGYIIENSTKTRVLTPNGDEVLAKDFAGFTPGSEIILTKDLPSLLQFATNGITANETSGKLKALL